MKKRKPSDLKTSPEFIAFRNRVRGANRPPNAISEGRESLPTELFREAIAWLNSTPYRGVPSETIHFPKTYAHLRAAPDLAPVSLGREFLWAAETLAYHADALRRFRQLANVYSRHLCASQYEDATVTLDTIETTLGKSLWAMEARIALLELFKGTAAQKDFVSRITSESRQFTEVPYLAHYMSVRNEASMGVTSFLSTYLKHHAVQGLGKNHDAYLKFRLLPLQPTLLEHLPRILAIENGSSVIDLYETTVRIAQLLFQRWPDHFKSAVLPSLKALDNSVGDVRTDALRWDGGSAHPYLSSVTPIDSLAFDLFLQGDYQQAEFQCRKAITKHPDTFELLELQSRIRINSISSEPQQYGPFADGVIDSMASILSKDNRASESYFALMKISQNHWSLDWARQLQSFCEQEYGGAAPAYECAHTTAPPLMRPSTLYSPNTLSFGQIEFRETYLNRCIEATSGKLTIPYIRTLYEAAGPDLASDVAEGLSLPHLLLLQAERHRLKRSKDEALGSLELLRDAGGQYFKHKAIRARARVLLELGDLAECVEYITSIYVNNPLLESLLPITSTVNSIDDIVREQLVGDISLSVLYHIYLIHYGGNLGGLPQFVAEDFLTACCVRRPSELGSLANKFDRAKLIYYLRYICVPAMIDTQFKNTTELNEERIAICQLLTELDPEHKAEYQSEITETARRQLITRRMKEIDQSKIYVDIERIKRIAASSLRDSFLRYMTLPTTSAAAAVIERVVEAVRKNVESKDVLMLHVPSDEKSAALETLLTDIRDLFVSNSEHGLDGYLSVRIRHGTLEGQLRSALEHANLLTAREKDTNDYKPNSYWASQLLTTEADIAIDIGKRLGRFSHDFDGIIGKMKGEWIQIKTDSRGQGLFDFTLGETHVAYVSASVQPDMTFDQFIDLVLAMLWTRLDHCLTVVRQKISTSAREMFESLLGNLQWDLERVARGHVDIRELDDSIKSARIDLTNTLNRIAQWFQLPKQTSATPFPVEDAISIALESVKRFHRGYELNPSLSIHEEVSFPGLVLPAIVDIFIMLFENIVQHSDLPAPYVGVAVERREEWTVFRMTNEIGPGVYSDAAVSHLEDLRAALERGDYLKSVAAEGGTGFHKVWKIIWHDLGERARLQFGFVSHAEFVVEFAISLQI